MQATLLPFEPARVRPLPERQSPRAEAEPAAPFAEALAEAARVDRPAQEAPADPQATAHKQHDHAPDAQDLPAVQPDAALPSSDPAAESQIPAPADVSHADAPDAPAPGEPAPAKAVIAPHSPVASESTVSVALALAPHSPGAAELAPEPSLAQPAPSAPADQAPEASTAPALTHRPEPTAKLTAHAAAPVPTIEANETAPTPAAAEPVIVPRTTDRASDARASQPAPDERLPDPAHTQPNAPVAVARREPEPRDRPPRSARSVRIEDVQAPRVADQPAPPRPAPAKQYAPAVQAATPPTDSDPAPVPARPAPVRVEPDHGLATTLGAPVPRSEARAAAEPLVQAQSPGANVDPRAVEAQITRGLSAAVRQNGGSLTIRLNPPMLGNVKIHMQLEAGVVGARIEAVTAQAHGLLKGQVESLRAALESKGLQVERLTVQLATGHAQASSPSQQHPGRQEGQPGAGQDRSAQHDAGDGRSKGSFDGREDRAGAQGRSGWSADRSESGGEGEASGAFVTRLRLRLDAIA